MNWSPNAIKAVNEVTVYRGDQKLGILGRTKKGARFTYDEAHVDFQTRDSQGALCFSMPVRKEPYEVRGVNLHAFFAGLLPEGLRFQALARRVKTSQDDLFSLLVALGENTVGDVWVTNQSRDAGAEEATVDVDRLSELSFTELLEESLYPKSRGDLVAIAGVQPKVSAAMISLPVRTNDRQRSYILKFSPSEFPKLVENEDFFMSVARSLKLSTANSKLIHDRSGQAGLLVERFDRVSTPAGKSPMRLHQEDACQLLDRYPADKYRLEFTEISDSLECCTAPIVERLRLLQWQALSYLIANGDLHGKNISVQVVKGQTRLTPIYDLLSTLPYGDEGLAIPIDGRDKKLKRKHFLAHGERIGIRPAAATRMLDNLIKGLAPHIPEVRKIGLDARKTSHLERTIQQRLKDLSGA